MKKRRILVVEDDRAIREGLADALDFAGYAVSQADNGQDGLDAALRSDLDLILLDLVLPRRGGLEILEEVRAARPTLPVIILTARGEEADRVKGLKLGADDYVVKPFSVKELLARVEAVLRRSAERPSDVATLSFPGRIADLESREIRHTDGGRCGLSEREADILRYLARNAGRAISREELLARVWRIDPRGVETRTIDVHIARLREKLRDDPEEPQIIRTVRGKGYVLAGSEGK